MITTTLNRIREHSPSPLEWEKLLTGLGKTEPDDEPLSFATILKINGLGDALWCCRVEPQYAREWRLFAVTCARRVERFNTDPRVKNVIDVAERYANGEATDEELRFAWAVANATLGAAWIALETEKYAAWRAAMCAAMWAAKYATRTDARVAWEAAKAAEREWQKQEFLRVVTETE